MNKFGRRSFLKAMGFGTLGAAMPTSISRALAIPANDPEESSAQSAAIGLITRGLCNGS